MFFTTTNQTTKPRRKKKNFGNNNIDSIGKNSHRNRTIADCHPDCPINGPDYQPYNYLHYRCPLSTLILLNASFFIFINNFSVRSSMFKPFFFYGPLMPSMCVRDTNIFTSILRCCCCCCWKAVTQLIFICICTSIHSTYMYRMAGRAHSSFRMALTLLAKHSKWVRLYRVRLGRQRLSSSSERNCTIASIRWKENETKNGHLI